MEPLQLLYVVFAGFISFISFITVVSQSTFFVLGSIWFYKQLRKKE